MHLPRGLGLGLAVAAALGFVTGVRVGAQQGRAAPGSLVQHERFAGAVSLRTKAGARRTVRVTIRHWLVNGGQKISRFPESGLRVVQLRGGAAATVVGGKRQQRQVDEFWTVPPGSTMGLETGRDQAILEVVAVQQR